MSPPSLYLAVGGELKIRVRLRLNQLDQGTHGEIGIVNVEARRSIRRTESRDLFSGDDTQHVVLVLRHAARRVATVVLNPGSGRLRRSASEDPFRETARYLFVGSCRRYMEINGPDPPDRFAGFVQMTCTAWPLISGGLAPPKVAPLGGAPA